MKISNSFAPRLWQREPAPPPQESPDSFAGSALCLGGGAVSLVGGLGGSPWAVAGGNLLMAAGSAMLAWRSQRHGLEGSAVACLAAGGAMSLMGAGLILAPLPTSAPPHGPLPQWLQRMGLSAQLP